MVKNCSRSTTTECDWSVTECDWVRLNDCSDAQHSSATKQERWRTNEWMYGWTQPRTHGVGEPAVGDERPLLLHAHHLPHVLEARVVGHLVVERRLVLLHDPCPRTTQTQRWAQRNWERDQRSALPSPPRRPPARLRQRDSPLLYVRLAISHSTRPKAQMSTRL